MSKYTFQVILGGTIEIEETPGAKSIKVNPAWRAQAILDGFVRESLAQAASGVVVGSVSASFVERQPNPFEMLSGGIPGAQIPDGPSTETPDISPQSASDRLDQRTPGDNPPRSPKQ